MTTKTLTRAGLLTAAATMLQSVPAFLSEAFAFVTMLSSLPICLIAGLSPRAGVLSFVATGFLTTIFSVHEGFLFCFTNGPVGLSLGLCHYYGMKKTGTWLVTGLILACCLSFLQFALGFAPLGRELPGGVTGQAVLTLVFSLIHSGFYLLLSARLVNRLRPIVFCPYYGNKNV